MHPSTRRQTIGDILRRTAQRLPQKLAVHCGDQRWSYAEFDALVTRLAAGLAGRGIAYGDRVAVLSHVRREQADIDIAVVHILRFSGGRIVEMWDVGQVIPKDSPNALGMF